MVFHIVFNTTKNIKSFYDFFLHVLNPEKCRTNPARCRWNELCYCSFQLLLLVLFDVVLFARCVVPDRCVM
jgi:hypothetical protein